MEQDFRRLRDDLIKAANHLEKCWGHHGDGSDLLVNQHELFNIMYGKVNPLLRQTIKEIHEQTGDESGKDWNCDRCGIGRNYGGLCPYCTKALDEIAKEGSKI